MTSSTISPTQSMIGQGTSAMQQGQVPGFPVPLGIEQYLGLPQMGAGTQQPYPGSQQPNQQQYQVHQVVQHLAAQILPVAHQIILPQVVAAASQQLHQHLQQLVTQYLAQYAGGQAYGGWGGQQFSGGWQQQPFTGQYGFPFGQAGRPGL